MPVHEPKEQRIGDIETVKLIVNSRCSTSERQFLERVITHNFQEVWM